MAESVGKSVGAITFDNRLAAEGAGYSDESTAKPISRKKETTRKRRHGKCAESKVDTVAMIDANYIGLLKELPHNYIERR